MAHLPAAITLGLLSAVVYGTSIVVQHRVVHNTRASGWVGLKQILTSPIWLLAILGDFFGFILQVAALSLGPVVIIQPLAVLMLPVALGAGYLMGGPRPAPADYGWCALLASGLGGFLWIVGDAQQGEVPEAVRILGVLILVLSIVLGMTFVTTSAPPIPRGAVLGAMAGICWGSLAVFVNAASDTYDEGGYSALFNDPRGWLPLLAIGILGVLGMVLTLASFKIGSLAVVLPVNLIADPMSAIIFGSLLLGQKIPLDAPSLFGYSICFCAVAFAAVKLAQPVVRGLQSQEVGHDQAQSA